MIFFLTVFGVNGEACLTCSRTPRQFECSPWPRSLSVNMCLLFRESLLFYFLSFFFFFSFLMPFIKTRATVVVQSVLRKVSNSL